MWSDHDTEYFCYSLALLVSFAAAVVSFLSMFMGNPDLVIENLRHGIVYTIIGIAIFWGLTE